MNQPTLFELPEEPEPSRPAGKGKPRLRCVNRQQVVFRQAALDDLLSDDHPARLIWQYVDGLDFGPIHEQIRSVEGHAGRASADPKILLALWLYATLDGVGSARELNRLCTVHAAYQWICGDVPMNYHSLADFRTAHSEFLDELLTQSVATLMHEGLVTLNRVAQDGMRVRASAGSSSFRREKTLKGCLAEAKEQVKTLRKEIEDDPSAANKRQQAARQRAAHERQQRVQNALDQLDEVRSKKPAKDRDKARVSTTDPDARVMKFADGGFRPGHNVQFATDVESQIIVGVDVTNFGGDQGEMSPMVEQIESRHGKPPDEMLVDGGFAKLDDIEKVSPPHGKTTVYAPVKKSKNPDIDIHAPRSSDSPAIAEWRARMATDEAKEIYKERAATAECVNAIARNRGFWQFPVRGSPKVRTIALWYALLHNVMRAIALRVVPAVPSS